VDLLRGQCPFTIQDSARLSQDLEITFALREPITQAITAYQGRIRALVHRVLVDCEGACVVAHSAALDLFQME
jgi:hypothetical protein